MPVYTDAANPDLLDRIPLDAKIVVDVGCGTGALGAEYKRRNPACRYIGIELDPVAARVAATRLDHVAMVDVEQNPLPYVDRDVDCIVYGDVLEHLRDPWTVLAEQSLTLRDSGVVLVCMPNVEHWSFAERLLRGTWSYDEQGLFDRTHLRWFNFETTRKALAGAGLIPLEVAPRVFDRDAAHEFTRALAPGLAALGIDPERYLARAAPLQHVWRASRRPFELLNIVSTMLPPQGGVSDVRISEPMHALSSAPGVVTRIVRSLDQVELPPGTPRIFVFHRPILTGDAGYEQVRKLVARGYLVLCEFDDHPDYIPVLHGVDVQNFRAVHAVQTSTEPLAAVLRRDNPEVAAFPNAIASLPAIRNHATPGRLTLFFGGLNREQDWPPYLPALNAVAAVAGERLHFQIVNDRGLFDALQTPHKSFTPLCDYDSYKDLLSRSEISFMPLLDTPFNRCKSDLKFLEAGAYRVAALATPTVYGNSIEDGRTGLLFDDVAGLQQKLMRLIANPEVARAMGDAAHAHVAAHRMLAYQIGQRVAWYRSLWERRQELHRNLLERVPELARIAPGELPD